MCFATRSISVITILAVNIGWLLSGAVVVEYVFSYPGLGSLLVRAVSYRDYPVIQGLSIVFAVLVIAVNLTADLSYILVDRRVLKHDGVGQNHKATGALSRRLAEELRQWPVTLKVGTGIIRRSSCWPAFSRRGSRLTIPTIRISSMRFSRRLEHPFGTDMFGRDIFARVLYGIRIDMQIGFFTTYVPMTYGSCSARWPAITAAGSTPSSCACSTSRWRFRSWS